MAVTQIDLDDEALGGDVVNLALRDYVERFRRAAALDRSREQTQAWDHRRWTAVRADEKALRD